MTNISEQMARNAPRKKPGRTVKQVRLKLVYVDFWSAVKLSFLVALSISVVILVTFFLIWLVLNQIGVFTSLSGVFADLLGDPTFDLLNFLSLSQVMTFGAVLAVLNVLCLTILGGVCSVLYNLSVKVTGGLLIGFTNS